MLASQSYIDQLAKEKGLFPTLPFSFEEQTSPFLQVPSREFETGIFLTEEGYREGYILARNQDRYRVRFYRDENGNRIEDVQSVPVSRRVEPRRKNSKPVWILVNKGLSGSGYVRSQHPLNLGYGIGSGLNGKFVRKLKAEQGCKYPIYTPITFHSAEHRKMLTRTSSLICQLVVDYSQEDLLDRIHWLINTFLYIDGFPGITLEVLLEAITNFTCDYLSFPPGTILRQPINYIFDILNIDGVCSEETVSKVPSVSFISTDFVGVTYQ